MSLKLTEIQTISEMSDFLYNFLPGKPYPYANQRISFAGIALDLKLDCFWEGGSKRPAITALLEGTLLQARDKFCSLIIQVVKRGIQYRSKSNPIKREDIEQLNEYIQKLGFKIPELWDAEFLRLLPSAKPREVEVTSQTEVLKKELSSLLNELIGFDRLAPQKRGYSFENFLTKLFIAFGMRPRSSFRLVGEQIDGSIEFEGNTYLIEAKWQSSLVGNIELLGLHGKVGGKSTWSRGIFISYTGFSKDGLEAFSRGRPTNLIAVSGQDLFFILEGKMPLDQMIRFKARCAAEEGRTYVPVHELFINNYK